MARDETVHRLVGGRYTLLEPLGRGGMGTVWRAHDELLQRDVAVKHVVLPAVSDSPEAGSARDRVMREARAAARLSHPASVTVFDVLEDDGGVYIVMELLGADTLAGVVERRGPLDRREAARIGLELLGALEAAHRQGIVHRDVKPGNVMLLPTGAVKLTDFGIASVQDHPSLTSTGQVLGSPPYMAPEQALGHPVGPEADWWGLGAALYYALEGRAPFERPTALATLAAVVNEDPAPTELAGPMSPLLGRLLAKEPGLRPGGPELRTLLRRQLDGSVGPHLTGGTDVGRDDTVVVGAAVDGRSTEAARRNGSVGPAADRSVDRVVPRHPRDTAGGGRSRRPVATALVAVVAVVVGAAVWASSSGTTGGHGDETSSTTTASPAGGEAGNGGVAAPAVTPAGWITYTDPKTGYRVAHPPEWQVRVLDRTRTDITDPATGAYLRMDWTDTPGPSPAGAWEAQSKSFGGRHEAYQQIRIEPTTFKGFDAAIWEYAYSAGRKRLHAVNLGMVTGRYGFALNFQSTEDRWAQSQEQFESFKASFQAPA